jgi:hypothetical protein
MPLRTLAQLSVNWAAELTILQDGVDGIVESVADAPRPSLVRLVTTQQLSHIYHRSHIIVHLPSVIKLRDRQRAR